MSAYEWVMIAAILVAPLLAVQAQRAIEAAREKRARRLRIFHILMASAMSACARSGSPQMKGVGTVLARLRNVRAFDDFDSALFELLTAHRYLRLPSTSALEFLPPLNVCRPEFTLASAGERPTVECKKFARRAQATAMVMQAVEEVSQATLFDLARQHRSCLIELSIRSDPRSIRPNDLAKAVNVSLDTSTTIFAEGFTITSTSRSDIASLDSREWDMAIEERYSTASELAAR